MFLVQLSSLWYSWSFSLYRGNELLFSPTLVSRPGVPWKWSTANRTQRRQLVWPLDEINHDGTTRSILGDSYSIRIRSFISHFLFLARLFPRTPSVKLLKFLYSWTFYQSPKTGVANLRRIMRAVRRFTMGEPRELLFLQKHKDKKCIGQKEP